VTVAEIAVVVCTRDRPALLGGLLPGLVDAAAAGADVVVVDSASQGPETRQLAEAAGLRVLRCDRPGASRARNAGLRATTADVVVFTDDDCRPRAGWTGALATAFADGAVGFATGRVLPGEGPGRAMSPMERAEPARWRLGDDVDQVGHGACMAVRRSAFEAVRGFDEVLGAGAPLHGSEEKDLFWRMLHAGWEGQFVPAAEVEHVAWRDGRESLRNGYRYGVGIGARTAKVARIEGARSAPLVVGKSWESLRQTGRTIRAGRRFGTLNLTVRAVGIVVGGARARRYPIVEGRFAE
jgi:glycosyltransferase involved in cell wall biosynthesis